jgi:Ca2+-binding EF-hand superfamily protein
MKELFSMCDVNQDGVVSKNELFSVMQQLGLISGTSESDYQTFERFFRDLDVNHNGELTFEEFLRGFRWLQKVLTLLLFMCTLSQLHPSGTISSLC